LIAFLEQTLMDNPYMKHEQGLFGSEAWLDVAACVPELIVAVFLAIVKDILRIFQRVSTH
jgi:hypothetical protein